MKSKRIASLGADDISSRCHETIKIRKPQLRRPIGNFFLCIKFKSNSTRKSYSSARNYSIRTASQSQHDWKKQNKLLRFMQKFICCNQSTNLSINSLSNHKSGDQSGSVLPQVDPKQIISFPNKKYEKIRNIFNRKTTSQNGVTKETNLLKIWFNQKISPISTTKVQVFTTQNEPVEKRETEELDNKSISEIYPLSPKITIIINEKKETFNKRFQFSLKRINSLKLPLRDSLSESRTSSFRNRKTITGSSLSSINFFKKSFIECSPTSTRSLDLNRSFREPGSPNSARNAIFNLLNTDANIETIPKNSVELNFSLTNLTTFPVIRLRNNKIKRMQMQKNNIKYIPRNISDLSNLKYLDVSYNDITYLPESLCELKFLIVLNLSYNSIDRLPENFYLLNSLAIINLNFNDIQFLPENIGKLVNIKTLNIESNLLVTIPVSLAYSSTLMTLNIQNNFIDIIPCDFTFSHATINAINNLNNFPIDYHLSNLEIKRRMMILLKVKRRFAIVKICNFIEIFFVHKFYSDGPHFKIGSRNWEL
ncbi:MAG: hypothetical protein JKX76_01010 [Colwellia sp.]|nr:hypothetical protein [Colwellia sp.]